MIPSIMLAMFQKMALFKPFLMKKHCDPSSIYQNFKAIAK